MPSKAYFRRASSLARGIASAWIDEGIKIGRTKEALRKLGVNDIPIEEVEAHLRIVALRIIARSRLI